MILLAKQWGRNRKKGRKRTGFTFHPPQGKENLKTYAPFHASFFQEVSFRGGKGGKKGKGERR